jgi:hypothetical protein
VGFVTVGVALLAWNRALLVLGLVLTAIGVLGGPAQLTGQ